MVVPTLTATATALIFDCIAQAIDGERFIERLQIILIAIYIIGDVLQNSVNKIFSWRSQSLRNQQLSGMQ
jgi:hypothetical protein